MAIMINLHRLAWFAFFVWIGASACVVEQVEDDNNTSTSSSGTGGSTSSSSGTGGSTSSSSGTGGCAKHWECPTDDVCIAGACNLAWGRVFRFTMYSAELPGTNPADGLAWDLAGGAPDPYVEGYYGDDQLLGTSPVVDDSFKPIWNVFFDIVLNKYDGKIKFLLWDEDTFEHDFATGFSALPTTWLEAVKSQQDDGTYTWQDQGMYVTVFVAVL